MAFSVVVKKSYLVIVRVVCEWNERIEWLENVGFFHGSEVTISWGVVKGELLLFTCSVLMCLLLCLRVWRLYINVIFCCCGCLWDYYFNAFDCLNNFFSLTLSSRTSPFRKRPISLFGVGLPRTMCVRKRAVTQHTCFKKIFIPSSSNK